MPRLLVLLLLALSALGAYAQDFSEADNSQASAVDAFDEFEVDTDASGASAAFTEVSVPMQHSFDGKKWEEADRNKNDEFFIKNRLGDEGGG